MVFILQKNSSFQLPWSRYSWRQVPFQSPSSSYSRRPVPCRPHGLHIPGGRFLPATMVSILQGPDPSSPYGLRDLHGLQNPRDQFLFALWSPTSRRPIFSAPMISVQEASSFQPLPLPPSAQESNSFSTRDLHTPGGQFLPAP